MSPLNIEVYKPYEAKWLNIGEVFPDCETTPLKNFNSNGERETIIFDCAKDDSSTTVFIFTKNTQELFDLPSIVRDNLESIEAHVLEKGDSYIIESRKIRDGDTKLLRLTHI